ncbi:MAG TPA: helix-turn-helix transcriptional regulator [Methylophilaceae bacterium]|jgi:transcriptional regulator with XRE-family HTH domain
MNAETLRNIRKSRRESQTKFWKRFGVTQSRGSRFELGGEMPSPITILIELYLEGVIADRDLQRARQNISRSIMGYGRNHLNLG